MMVVTTTAAVDPADFSVTFVTTATPITSIDPATICAPTIISYQPTGLIEIVIVTIYHHTECFTMAGALWLMGSSRRCLNNTMGAAATAAETNPLPATPSSIRLPRAVGSGCHRPIMRQAPCIIYVEFRLLSCQWWGSAPSQLLPDLLPFSIPRAFGEVPPTPLVIIFLCYTEEEGMTRQFKFYHIRYQTKLLLTPRKLIQMIEGVIMHCKKSTYGDCAAFS